MLKTTGDNGEPYGKPGLLCIGSQVQLPNGRATILSINAAYVQIAIYGMTASLFQTAHHYNILSIR